MDHTPAPTTSEQGKGQQPACALPADLAYLALQALEEEFWSGRHHRGRLLAAPLRVLLPHLPPHEPTTRALLSNLAQQLEAASS